MRISSPARIPFSFVVRILGLLILLASTTTLVPAQKAVGAPTAYENPSAALVPVGGRVTTVDGRGMAKTFVTLTDEEGRVRVTLTNGFGYYDFDEVESGKTYIITPVRTGYQFESRVVSLSNEQGDLDFVGIE